MMTPHTVAVAAIRAMDGKVFSVPRPGRHHDVIALMVKEGYPIPVRGLQGFLLSNGEFVGRLMAARIAKEAGQIKDTQWPPQLYSEDLW